MNQDSLWNVSDNFNKEVCYERTLTHKRNIDISISLELVMNWQFYKGVVQIRAAIYYIWTHSETVPTIYK